MDMVPVGMYNLITLISQIDSTKKPFFNIARKDFDNFLWSTIPNPIDKYEEYKPTQVSYEWGKGMYRIEIKRKHECIVFYASYILGADGANSWVRKKIGLFPEFVMEFATARRVYASVPNPKDAFELNYVSANCLSYVWNFSLPNNKINSGVYFSATQSNAERENGKKYIERSGNRANAKVDWSTCSSFPIPTFHSSVCIFAKKGVFLVGDAAGLSDPIFGHGIDIGMLSAKIAIQSIFKVKELFVLNRKKKAAQIYNTYINKNIATKFNNMRAYMNENTIYRIDDIMKLMRNNMIVNNDLTS
jgi:flavin-dependent dehydrogenase